jgi:hypothetical protein
LKISFDLILKKRKFHIRRVYVLYYYFAYEMSNNKRANNQTRKKKEDKALRPKSAFFVQRLWGVFAFQISKKLILKCKKLLSKY